MSKKKKTLKKRGEPSKNEKETEKETERQRERVERDKLEIRTDKERSEIGKRLEKAEKEIQKITETELVEVAGAARIAHELNRLKDQVADLSPTRDLRHVYGFIAIIVFLGILAVPTSMTPGLSVMGQRALAIFALIFVLWITEAIPLPAAALVPGFLLYFLGIRPNPTEAFKTYAHPVIFFIIGSLLIAQGLIQSGLAKRFALVLLTRAKNSPLRLLFILIVTSALLGAFVSDHLVAAMLLPVVIAVVVAAKIEGKFRAGLILAVAFGTGIAGLATPSGGARNVITLGLLQELTGQTISYMEWLLAALPLTLMLIPVVLVILWLMFPPEKSFNMNEIQEKLTAELKPMTKKQWRVLGVFIFTILLFILTSDLIGLGTAAIIGAVLMFLIGGVDWAEAEKGVAWGIMFIYGAAITMGIALMDTGAAQWLASSMLQYMSSSPFVLVSGVSVVSVLLTSVMSDGAATTVLAPITINLGLLATVDTRILALATAIPTAFAYATIFGTPPNAIAYSSGYFTAKDLAKSGLILIVVAIVLLHILMRWYWPLLGLVP